MARLKDQLTRMIKTTPLFREGIKEDEELDLAEIDRGLDIAVEKQLTEAVDAIMGKNK